MILQLYYKCATIRLAIVESPTVHLDPSGSSTISASNEGHRLEIWQFMYFVGPLKRDLGLLYKGWG